MSSGWSRRTFLVHGTVAAAGLGAAASLTAGSPHTKETGGSLETPVVEDWFPGQDPARVKEVVGVSHGNFDRVRELVTASPALAKATWDWGFGDWESALGAASHTGNRDIALFLIENGARPTIFSAAMLGQLAVVRAHVEASPGVQRLPGPHGIPLLVHARLGGDPARPVVEYLETLGDAGNGPASQPLAEKDRDRYFGTYAFGPGETDRVEVFMGRHGMMIRRQDMTPRGLVHLGNHEFHPAGAVAVRIRFVVAGEKAGEVSVYDPGLLMRAVRVG
jgi:hypothetical protein